VLVQRGGAGLGRLPPAAESMCAAAKGRRKAAVATVLGPGGESQPSRSRSDSERFDLRCRGEETANRIWDARYVSRYRSQIVFIEF
jgi:hypothetical protein